MFNNRNNYSEECRKSKIVSSCSSWIIAFYCKQSNHVHQKNQAYYDFKFNEMQCNAMEIFCFCRSLATYLPKHTFQKLAVIVIDALFDLHKFNFESKYFLTNWWHFKQWICTSAFNAYLYMWIFCVNICGVSVSYIYWILRNYFNFHHKYILSYCIMLWFIVLLMKLKYNFLKLQW